MLRGECISLSGDLHKYWSCASPFFVAHRSAFPTCYKENVQRLSCSTLWPVKSIHCRWAEFFLNGRLAVKLAGKSVRVPYFLLGYWYPNKKKCQLIDARIAWGRTKKYCRICILSHPYAKCPLFCLKPSISIKITNRKWGHHNSEILSMYLCIMLQRHLLRLAS